MSEDMFSTFTFSSYFIEYVVAYLVALLTYVVGIALYCNMTPHSEVKLLRAGNPAASLALSATMLALAVPIAAAVHNTHNALEIAVWGSNAVLFQLAAYFGITRVIPEINVAIVEGKVMNTLPLVSIQLSVAILNAAIFAG